MDRNCPNVIKQRALLGINVYLIRLNITVILPLLLVAGTHAGPWESWSLSRISRPGSPVPDLLATRTGDAKKLKPPRSGFRLRCGDYRLFFEVKDENTIEITGVRHRREAYR